MPAKRFPLTELGTESVPDQFPEDLKILLSVEGNRFSDLISHLEKNRDEWPSPKELSEILGLAPKEARASGRAFVWIIYNFSIEAITAEEITNYVELLGLNREKGQQLCMALQKMSPTLHGIMKRRGILRYVGEYRVVPHFHALGFNFDFRPVTPKDKTIAILPLVTLNFVAYKEGEEKEHEMIVEMNANELERFRKSINEIAEKLDKETVRLSQKLGDTVMSTESVLALGEWW